jgi:hypothetical protein
VTALSESFEGVTVVVDHGTGEVVRLNAAAGCVWDALASPGTLGDVVAALIARFGISVTTAQADASAALAKLESARLVIRSP